MLSRMNSTIICSRGMGIRNLSVIIGHSMHLPNVPGLASYMARVMRHLIAGHSCSTQSKT